jgi:hypothetical protein
MAKAYEYETITVRSLDDLITMMNEKGELGWRLLTFKEDKRTVKVANQMSARVEKIYVAVLEKEWDNALLDPKD